MMVFNCKACGKPIVFITTVAGKKMPCDAMVRAYEPDADGPDTIITKDGQTVRGRVLAPAADGGKLGRIPALGKLPRRRRAAQNAESEVIFAETLNLR